MTPEYGHSKFSQEHHGIFERSLRSGQTITRKESEHHKGYSTVNFPPSDVSKKNLGAVTDSSLFQEQTVKNIMDRLLEDQLGNQTYQADSCRALCLRLCELIKAHVKRVGMDNHRLICNVSIGSKSGQGVFMASRFLWDSPNDNFCTSTFQNSSLFAVAIVYGVTKN